jgi:hypothetical protein
MEETQEVQTSLLYNGEVTISFNPASHRYKIVDRGVKVQCPSVTTITSLADFGKSSALQNWAVRMCLEVCRQRILPDQIHGAAFLEEAFQDAAANYKTVRDKAADTGTLAHAALERYFTEPDAAPPLSGTPIRARFDEALNWYGKRKIESIGNEIRVYSRKHKFSGTLDHAAIVDGIPSLIDFKAAKSIYKPYEMQLAAYIGAFEEQRPDIKIEQAWILQIGEERAIPYKYTRKQIDAAYDSFLSLRKVYEWNRSSGKIKAEEENWIENL